MDEKDKWIHEIENSLHDLQRPEVNPYLYTKILTKLQGESQNYLKPKLVWISAVSFLLLVLLNIILFNSGYRSRSAEADAKHISKALNLMNENTINYN